VKLRIEKAIYGGSGMARADGKAVFVPFTLPGETVEAEIVADKGGFSTAELRAVIEPSPARVHAPCPYFGRCGGCHYQHADYATQMEMKISILRESLERAGITEIPDIEAITSEPLGYRNRIRLHVQANPFNLCYKFHKSHVNLPVANCPIAVPVLQDAIETLNQDGQNLGLAAFVTEIELFAAPDEASLIVSFWTDRTGPAAQTFIEQTSPRLRKNIPQIREIGVFAMERSRATSRLLARTGSEPVLYTSGNHCYRVGLGSFFQVNRFLIDPLVQLVTAGESGSSAWDLYAGVGLFSVPLAETFTEVTAVEFAASAVRDLRDNLRGTKHRVVSADASTFLLRSIRQSQPAPDLLVVDPPRAGMGREVTDALRKIRPRKITYVSCDPATLSRDLAALVGSGYRLSKLHLLDLFPQTFHLETVVHLSVG
jgi:23S rRNA (uracil1939-C5)-methyltransferase